MLYRDLGVAGGREKHDGAGLAGPGEDLGRVDVEHAERCRRGQNESLDFPINSKSLALALTR